MRLYTRRAPRARNLSLTPPPSRAARAWSAIKRIPASIAALTCVGVGIGYNVEFASQFGNLAIALAVAADVLKAAAGPMLRAAVQQREWGKALASACVLVVTLTVSLVAAFGSAQHRREDAVDGRADAIRAYDDNDKARKRLEAELVTLGAPRPVAVIQAEVSATKIDMAIWRRSSKCEDISREDSRTACQPILALYKERGNAARKTEVDGELATLRPKLAKGRPDKADPQAAAIAALTGASEDQVRRGISILIVLLIEIGVIGGSIMAAAPRARLATGAEDRRMVPANDPADCPAESGADRADAPAEGDRPAIVRPDHAPERDAPAGSGAGSSDVGDRPAGRLGPERKDQVLAALQADVAAGRSAGSNAELSRRFGGVPRATMSDWLREWEAAGLIPERRREGRCKALVAAPAIARRRA